MKENDFSVTHSRVLYSVENALCFISFGFLVIVPAAEALVRLVTHTGIPGSTGLITHMLLAAGMLAGMIAERGEEHLSIALVQYLSGVGGPDSAAGRLKTALRSVTNLISAYILTIAAFTGPVFIRMALTGEMQGFLPDWAYAVFIPIGYMVLAVRFARRTGFNGWMRILPVLAVAAGVVFSIPQIAKFFWGFDLPAWVTPVHEALRTITLSLKVPVIIILIISALAGAPLFVIMAGLALSLFETCDIPADTIALVNYTALTDDSIIAIPLFTVLGFFLSESRAGERLVRTFRSIFAWLPGGMIIATVIICAFFTSFTGASGVTILALGGILLQILTEAKYPQKFSIGLLTSVGSVGLLFPPSLPLILVGAMTGAGILQMLAGGLIPGVILVATVILFGIILSLRVKIPVQKFEAAEAGQALKGSLLEILLPFLLIAGYFSGILTLTEIGAVGLIYIFIVESLVHKDIPLKDVPKVFLKAAPIIGGVIAILTMSQALSYYIVDVQAPSLLAEWMQTNVASKYVFLILLNLALLVVGCLMDIFSAILIVLPFITPLGEAYGIDPVHLGIIFITNLEVGFLTPPVGLNLFLASLSFKKPFVAICRYVFPFLLIQLAVVLLVTYVPPLSTWLAGFFN